MRRFRDIIEDIKAPGINNLWLNNGKLQYFDGVWKTIGDSSEQSDKYLPITGGEVTGTLGAYNLVLTNAQLGALVQMICSSNKFNINTLNAGIDEFEFNIQYNPVFRINEFGVYVEGNIFQNGNQLDHIYAKLTDIATTGAAGLMSADDKSKLDGIAEKANNYVHPTTSGNKHIPSGGSSGQILRWSADGTAVWGDDNNTTYSVASDTTDGLMSSTDKSKLDNIEENANNYTLPNASASTRGGVLMATAVADLAGTEDAAAICTKVNALLAALRTAGILNQ